MRAATSAAVELIAPAGQVAKVTSISYPAKKFPDTARDNGMLFAAGSMRAICPGLERR